MSSTRIDFADKTKQIIAARVNYMCSNPDCCAQTSGPQVTDGKALNIGVAAHITGAALGGPRYDLNMTDIERGNDNNGIWLCQSCAKLIDNDTIRFTAALLHKWKNQAEYRALHCIGKTNPNVNTNIVDLWVDINYPINAGIVKQLEEKGYEHHWTRADNENRRIDLEGWEPFILERPDGTRAKLKVRGLSSAGGYSIFLMKRK